MKTRLFRYKKIVKMEWWRRKRRRRRWWWWAGHPIKVTKNPIASSERPELNGDADWLRRMMHECRINDGGGEEEEEWIW